MSHSYDDYHGDQDEAEEEEEAFSAESTGDRDAILFLIDCRKPMLEKNANGESPLYLALKSAMIVNQEKIIAKDTDLVGVCLFGTREEKNMFGFKHVYVMHELDQPDAVRIQDLHKLTSQDYDETVEARFESKYGSMDEPVPLHEPLWAAQHLFSQMPKSVVHRRVFLFTNDPKPTGADASNKQKALQRAKDLSEVGITIDLFHLKKPFDASAFWEELLGQDPSGHVPIDGEDNLADLTSRLRRKEHRKRVPTRLQMKIPGSSMVLGVALFNTVASIKKSAPIWLDAQTNRPLRTETKHICADTGSELLESDMKGSYEIGGERAVFNTEEGREIRKIQEPGIKLLGFKPVSRLKAHHNYTHSSFIYPDDSTCQGSTSAFAALHAEMLAQEKMAIVQIVARRLSQPRFAALVPQKEVVEEGRQEQPPGFNIVFLPYADDIRKLQLPPVGENAANAEQVEKAKNMIRSLTVETSPGDFENPALQKHYRALEAMALNLDTAAAGGSQGGSQAEQKPRIVKGDEFRDLQPDKEGWKKREAIIEDFQKSIWPPGTEPVLPAAPTRKRKVEKVEGSEDGPIVKREKKEGDESAEERDWAKLCGSGLIAKLTIPQLKEYLELHRLPKSGKKDQLIERIKDHLTAHGKL